MKPFRTFYRIMRGGMYYMDHNMEDKPIFTWMSASAMIYASPSVATEDARRLGCDTLEKVTVEQICLT